MSTILRALQRLEGEKGGGEMGGLGEAPAPRDEPPLRERGGRRRIGLVAVVGVLLLGFFLWWLLPTRQVGEPSAESPPALAPAPGPQSEPAPRPKPRPALRPGVEIAAARPAAPEEPGVSPPSAPVAAAPQRPPVAEPPAPFAPVAERPPAPVVEPPAPPQQVAAPPPAPVAEPVPPMPVARELPAAERPPPIVEPVPRVPVVEALPAAEPPPPVEEPAPRVPVVEPPAAEPASPPPAVAPPAPKAPARVATVRPPKVTVRKIVWHPTSGRRVAEVEVEGRKGPIELHEGDAVGTLVVSEIRPSAVVFLHGGETLQHKVGSGR